MDFYDNDKKIPSLFSSSILQVDNNEIFSNKILARQSTMGSCSSRIYYRASSEGVPFQWETRPGKPIEPQPDDILPPLSPPPAVLAMGLPKPCIDNNVVDDHEPNRAWRWPKGWLMIKMIKKRIEITKWKVLRSSRKICNSSSGPGNFGSARYPSESTRYSRESSFASTSTYSSANGSINDKFSGVNKNESRDLMQGKPFTCGPRSFSSVVIHLAKRS